MRLLIDIGGTSIKYATFKDEISEINKMPTGVEKGWDGVLFNVFSIIDKYNAKDIEFISISQAGVVRRDHSILYGNDTIPFFTNKDFTAEIMKKYGIKAYAYNDANSAAAYFSLKNSIKDSIILVFGTGFGGCEVRGNSPYIPANGLHSEFGTIKVDGTYLDKVLSLSELKKKLDAIEEGIDFANVFKSQNVDILKVANNYFKDVARWLLNILFLTGKGNFYLGGSIPAFGQEGIDKINDEIQNHGYPSSITDLVKIQYIDAKEEANLLGAMYMALKIGVSLI